jgi:hypothetical protein
MAQGLLFCLKNDLEKYSTEAKKGFYSSFIFLLLFPIPLSNGSAAWVLAFFL